MKAVTIYTDGSCRGNPGPGGWAAVLMCDGHTKELAGGEPQTTNNRMELRAIIEALSAIQRPCAITVRSDSTYALGALDGKMGRANVDLLVEGMSQMHRITELGGRIAFEHINGHAGLPLNERCDALARAQSAAQANL